MFLPADQVPTSKPSLSTVSVSAPISVNDLLATKITSSSNLFLITKPGVSSIVSLTLSLEILCESIVNPPICPPVKFTNEPDKWPLCFNLKDSSDDFISSVLTTKPAIEADTNLAFPEASIDADELANVDGAPSIVAGVRILSTVISPLTVRVLPSYCI